MSKWRTEWITFQWDLLDFMEGKIQEAVSQPASQFAAVTEAAGALPLVKERLLEPERAAQWAQVVLFASDKVEGPAWWEALAKVDRETFLATAQTLVDPVDGFIPIMRKIVETDWSDSSELL